MTACTAVEAIGRGDISAAELFEAYRAAAAADDLNAYLWVAEEAPPGAGGVSWLPALAGAMAPEWNASSVASLTSSLGKSPVCMTFSPRIWSRKLCSGSTCAGGPSG